MITRAIILAGPAIVVLLGSTAGAGSPVYVGARTVRASVPLEQIDHSPWDSLLRKYVDSDGMVAYRSFKASATDQQRLISYLTTLSAARLNGPSPRDAQLAFWINAYNAITVHGILREYPTSSIRNHTARLIGYNIWYDLQLYVDGQPYSLDHIEHKILRPLNDPRIHFAIVCASISCPRLLNEAYTPDRVAMQLDANAKDFFSRAGNFRFDARRRRLELSSILDWFADDFGPDQAAQLRRIAPWLPTTAARQAAISNAVSVSHLDYNWNLNEQSRR